MKEEMRIKSRFIAGILTKLITRYFSKKFDANSIKLFINDLNVVMEDGRGEFSIIAHGSFTQDDISKLSKELLSE